ncbi:MAG: ComF family protein [Candidatus Omnitrophica bacterium]|nr:ComF family protein [Candidatus Omnitrophota bacterium]
MNAVLQKPISIFKTFLDVVLPPVCYVCKRSCSGKYGLCEDCLEKIRHIFPPQCTKCGRHLANNESICGECSSKNFHVERGWSPCYYEGTIKECIHLFKYNGYMGLMDIFKDIMVDFMKKNRIHKEIDLIVPVPVYPTKKRERTYNHAEILARSLAKDFAILVDSRNLKKIKWTQSQSELDKKKRVTNVRGSFLAVDRGAFSGKNVLLVDDVYTTGATLNECAKVILKTGANKVFSLTLARGI